jgi:uncharacterized protein (DUF697 family)
MWDDASPRERSELIIHGAALSAAGAAASTVIPGSDAVLIMPIQVGMVAAIAHQYGIEPTASVLRSTVYATLGSIVGKAGAGVLLRWVPVAGNLIRGGVAFSVTEALGQLILHRLEAGEGLG